MKIAKHTYKEWWEGQIYLETCAISFQKEEKPPVKCKIIDFNEDDIIKIKNKQKVLFEEQCEKGVLECINIFKERFKNSDAKLLYLRREMADMRRIFKVDPIPNETNFLNRNFFLSHNRLSNIRFYIREQIIVGKRNYDFVHSPQFIFKNNGISDEVFAQVNWDYNKWIIDFWKKEKINDVKANLAKKKVEEKLKMPVIALIHFYKKLAITRDNGKFIASQYNYTSKTSGEGLYQDYSLYSKKTSRIGLNDNNYKSNITKVKHIEMAIKKLSGKAKLHAENDLKLLKKAIDDFNW